MSTKTLLRDFQLANIGLIGCTLTVYTVDSSGAKTSTLATLYDSVTGSGALSNPQDLDSEGKVYAPIYHDVPVICEVTGAHVATIDTGAIFPGGSYRGDWTTATLYLPGDYVTDGANGDGTNDFYRIANYHTSGTWATDKADSAKLVRVIDMSTLTDQVVDDATESLKGKIEIATQTETNTGTDDVRAVTPLKLVTYATAAISAAIAAALAAAKTVAGLWTFTNTKSTVQTLTDAATIAWDVSAGNAAKVTLTASGHTIGAPTNIQAGGFYFLSVIQDATGSRTVNWNAAFKFGTAGTPTLTTTASKTDNFTFYSPDGSVLQCVGKALGF